MKRIALCLAGLVLALNAVTAPAQVWRDPGGGRIGAGVVGGTATRVLYVDSSGNLAGAAGVTTDGTHLSLGASSALKFSTDAYLTRYAAKQLMISGDGVGAASTMTGWILGNDSGTTSVLSHSGAAVSSSNYALATNGSTFTRLNTPTGGALGLARAGTDVVSIGSTAGTGISVAAGIATTDVAAFSLTRTNNNAAVATGVKWTFTDTTSAAGFLPFQILGGAAGTTNLLSVSKAGRLLAGAGILAGADVSATSFLLAEQGVYDDANGTVGFVLGEDNDANLSRISAGVIGVGTGAAGSTAGGLSLATVTTSGTILSGGVIRIQGGWYLKSPSSGRFQLANGSDSANIELRSNAPTMGACGTDPAVAGSDTAMVVTVGTGGAATSCAVTFSAAFTNAPVCSAINDTDRVAYSVVTTTTTATVSAAAAFTAGSKFHVQCLGYA